MSNKSQITATVDREVKGYLEEVHRKELLEVLKNNKKGKKISFAEIVNRYLKFGIKARKDGLV